jgi:GT2 family glycosyltransferase
MLSWGLVIATYNREKILPTCINLALEQSLKPNEIIIVDASKDWQKTREHILSSFINDLKDLRFIYTAAETTGLTLQRNQGLKLSSSDIVFFFDDDTLMYPDCAEEIMRLYELDVDKLIQGIGALDVQSPPQHVQVTLKKSIAESNLQKKNSGDDIYWNLKLKLNFVRLIFSFIWKNIFLMSAESLFIPYDTKFPNHILPAYLSEQNCTPVKLLRGFCMTYRREIIAAENFEPLLRYYAPGEDLDASYRVSRKGLLLRACNAKVNHFSCSSGRINRFAAQALSILNQSVLLRKYSSNLGIGITRFYILGLRRLLAEFLKDLLSSRYTLPQFRGLLLGLLFSAKVFLSPKDKIFEWYISFQNILVNF